MSKQENTFVNVEIVTSPDNGYIASQGVSIPMPEWADAAPYQKRPLRPGEVLRLPFEAAQKLIATDKVRPTQKEPTRPILFTSRHEAALTDPTRKRLRNRDAKETARVVEEAKGRISVELEALGDPALKQAEASEEASAVRRPRRGTSDS